MTKLFLWLGCAILFVRSNQSPEVGLIKFDIKGFTAEDSVLVICGADKGTVAAPYGVFNYEYPDSLSSMVQVYKMPKRLTNGTMEAFSMRPISVLMSPHHNLSVKGRFGDYEITGNDFYKEYNEVKKELSAEDSARQAVNAEYMVLLRNKAPREEIMKKFEELKVVDGVYQKKVVEYVANHLNSEAALYLLYLNRSADGANYLDKFSEEVKTGMLRNFYRDLSEYYEKMSARKRAATFIQEGKPAPDFVLKDISGKMFTLSSLKGKYVVLDFWGSWCGWCIKGFPEMKKVYEKYKGKLEFVGVDCNDTEEKWKAAVAKHGLKWINVINGTGKGNDLTNTYNISGFPTKIIISPEGKIVKIVVGEKKEFYETLETLIKL